MSGFIAYASTNPHPDPGVLTTRRDLLAHRGPDAAGLWCSADAQVVLAHRNLSTLDLSPTVCQPFGHHESGCQVVLDGAIYNRSELRAELEGFGHRFHTSADAELLAAAYTQWSTACLEQLVGMFAFVLYDERLRRVFAARDRAGEKPLYYWQSGTTCWFASELNALLPDPALRRQLDYDALDQYLAYGHVPGEHTLIKGVNKLRAGHALEFPVTSADLRQWAYWSLPEYDSVAAVARPSHTATAESLLRNAVKRQLGTVVPSGILLSGGLKSGLITAMAAHVAGPVTTFTVRFPGRNHDRQTVRARRVAERYETDHHEVPADAPTIELLSSIAAQLDEPVADEIILRNALIARAVREHLKVALSGLGADELFAGYPAYLRIMRQRRVRRFIPAPVRWLSGKLAGKTLPVELPARNYLRAMLDSSPRAVAHVGLFFDAETRRRLVPALAEHAVRRAPERSRTKLWRGRSLVQQLTRTDFQTRLPDGVLLGAERVSMLASLELRAPFLDADLLHYVFHALPDHLRLTERANLVLLRRLAGRLLPPDTGATRQRNRRSANEHWLPAEWNAFCRDALLVNDSGLFDRGVIARFLGNQGNGGVHDYRLFNLAVCELWLRARAVTY